MTIEQLFSTESMLLVMKIGFLMAYMLYFLFSVVVMAQVKQMTKTIDAGLNGKLLSASKVQIVLAALLFVLALVVL